MFLVSRQDNAVKTFIKHYTPWISTFEFFLYLFCLSPMKYSNTYQKFFLSNLISFKFAEQNFFVYVLHMYICLLVHSQSLRAGCGSEGFSYVTSTFLRVPSFLVVLYFSESSDIVSQVYIIINHLNCFLLLHFLWNLVSISI